MLSRASTSTKKKSVLLLTLTAIRARRKFLRARSKMLVNGQSDSVKGKVNEFSEKLQTIQEILRCSFADKSLQVISLQCDPGSKDGDNFMSLIKRIVAIIKTSNNSGKCQILDKSV